MSVEIKQERSPCRYPHCCTFLAFDFVTRLLIPNLPPYNRMWSVRHSQANKGMCAGFEEHVRCLMATGATARAIREGLFLNATHYLSPSEAAVYCGQVPKLDWFIKQREALGLESYLYTFMRIAGCAKIIQWGFDETTIDGHEVLNQWAMLMESSEGDDDKHGATTIVTLECAAILPCSEAQDVVNHIEEVWKRGKVAIDSLREQLGPDLRDIICPLKNGGVHLAKIYGVMHDTCNCANLVATLMVELRDRKSSEQNGENVWLQADKKTKACFNFLCGNHTRNLPVVRFNKVTTPPLTFTPTQTLALTLHSTSNFRRRRTTSGFMQRLESKRGQLNRRPVNLQTLTLTLSLTLLQYLTLPCTY